MSLITAAQLQPLTLTKPELCAGMRASALRLGVPVADLLRVAVEMFLEGSGEALPRLAVAPPPANRAADRHAAEALAMIALAPDGLQVRQISTVLGWSTFTTNNALRLLVEQGKVERKQVPSPNRGPWPYVYRVVEPPAAPQAPEVTP